MCHLCGKMLNNIRRYRYCRNIRIHNVGLRCRNHFVLLSTTSSHHQKIDFRDNSRRESMSIQNRMSKFLINFIKQETKVLADSLLQEDSEITSKKDSKNKIFHLAYSRLDQKIKEEIEKNADTYNKLSLILTYNPIVIHPLIYMFFYDEVTTALPIATKKLVLRRLIYHGEYETCWKIALDSIETLIDVDEYIETMTDELARNNNISFGLFDLLSACNKIVSNPSLKHTIIETICHNNDLGTDLIYSSLTHKEELQNFELLEALEHAKSRYLSSPIPYFRLLYYKRSLELSIELTLTDKSNARLDKIANDILQDKDVINKKGWLSSVVPLAVLNCIPNDISSLENVFPLSSKRGNFPIQYFVEKCSMANDIYVNDYDFLHILQHSRLKSVNHIYSLYRKNYNEDTSLMNPHLVNYLLRLMLINNDYDLIMTCTMECYSIINIEILTSALVAIFSHSNENFKVIANKIKNSKNDSRKSKLVHDFVNRLFCKDANQISLNNLLEIIKSFNKSDLASEAVLCIIAKLNSNGRPQNEMINFYMCIIQNIRISSYVLVEIARSFVLKERIYDEGLLTTLFSTLLERTWNREQIRKRNSHNSQHDDFQELFLLTTKKERARFHNRIRGLGQILSLLEPEDITIIFNVLHKYINSESFQFVESTYGKKYIMDNLVTETMRFINKSNMDNPKLGIMKMRDLLKNLSFESRAVQCALYKYMVEDEPLKSIKLLHAYKNNKSYLTNDVMRSIMSGILLSPKLEDKERLYMFQYFRSESQNLEFKNTIHSSTAIELLNLVIRITEKDPIKSVDSMKWVLDFARKKRIPKWIIANFARRLTFTNNTPSSIQKSIIDNFQQYK